MRTKWIALMTAVCSMTCLAGCGTIGARATNMRPPPLAGLRADFEALDSVLKNKDKIEPLWYWLGVPLVSAILVADIPVSAVFDLYCLPADLSRREKPEKSDLPTGHDAQGTPERNAKVLGPQGQENTSLMLKGSSGGSPKDETKKK